MSTRALAHLRKLDAAKAQEADGEQQEDATETAAIAVPAARSGPGFAALNDDSDESSGSADEAAAPATRPRAAAAATSPAPATAGGKKKKKNKKNKKAGKGAGKGAGTGQKSGHAAAAREDDEEAEIAKAVQEALQGLDLEDAGRTEVLSRLLATDPKSLSEENELRKHFGADVVRAAHVERHGEMRAMGRRGRHVARPRAPLRKSNLVAPEATWSRPPSKLEGGLYMIQCEPVETREAGCTYFRFQYGELYRTSQAAFEAAVATYDPNALVAFLQRHPFHTDALLQMADLHLQFGEHEAAAELVRRCLYALESAWHPTYNPLTGRSRLQYAVPENRCMFRALATHMRLLGKRGCARTAWAVGKLLLSMDPLSDPMGALLCVDYYAVRAHEDAWLAELVTSNACPRLVNLRFSVALALRNAGRGGGDEALATVLATFPRALAPLVLRCCGKGDDAAALPAEWREVLARPLFSDAMHAGAAGEATVWGSVAAAQRALDVEDKLVALFVERQRELWKWDAEMEWLLRCATQAAALPAGTLAGCARDRVQALQPGSPLHPYTRFRVSDVSDDAATMRRQDLAMMGADAAPQAPPRGNLDPNVNPLLLFLQTLLPWNRLDHEAAAWRHAPVGAGAAAAGDAAAGAAGDAAAGAAAAAGLLGADAAAMWAQLLDGAAGGGSDEEAEGGGGFADGDFVADEDWSDAEHE